MNAVSFLHQKGGTGKSTLAVGMAVALAARGDKVLLMDADYQGTASEWGNRFGVECGVETLTQVQPCIHEERSRLRQKADILIIDGPPSLSPMTESILKASDRVIIPIRPSRPDVWALPWLAAIIGKLRAAGRGPEPLVVFNMVRDEPLEPFLADIAAWKLPVHPRSIPANPAFQRVFEGQPLPGELAGLVLELLPP